MYAVDIVIHLFVCLFVCLFVPINLPYIITMKLNYKESERKQMVRKPSSELKKRVLYDNNIMD